MPDTCIHVSSLITTRISATSTYLKVRAGRRCLKPRMLLRLMLVPLKLTSNITMPITEFLMGKPGGSCALSPTKVCHSRVSMPTIKTIGRRANHRWPQAITANLWPYAIRAANDSLDVMPCARHAFKVSPLQVFSRADVDTNPTHWIPFGSPVYVLAAPLQGSKHIHNK
jgi:hypothetical protein